jgi:hypothetical protein
MEVKMKVPQPKEEDKATKEPEAKAKATVIPTEQQILVVGCINNAVMKQIAEVAHTSGMTTVVLDKQVVYDYQLECQKRASIKEMTNFLCKDANRVRAVEQALQVFRIVARGQNVEDAKNETFTETQLVKATTLTHKTANQLLTMLNHWGIVEFTKGTFEFRFNFSAEDCRRAINKEILALTEAMNTEILRYKSLIKEDWAVETSQEDRNKVVNKNTLRAEDVVKEELKKFKTTVTHGLKF